MHACVWVCVCVCVCVGVLDRTWMRVQVFVSLFNYRKAWVRRPPLLSDQIFRREHIHIKVQNVQYCIDVSTYPTLRSLLVMHRVVIT